MEHMSGLKGVTLGRYTFTDLGCADNIALPRAGECPIKPMGRAAAENPDRTYLVYMTCIVPVLLYGSESWSILASDILKQCDSKLTGGLI